MGVGFDCLILDEYVCFIVFNSVYVEKFGFFFIIVVKGFIKDDIFLVFEICINNDWIVEFVIVCV